MSENIDLFKTNLLGMSIGMIFGVITSFIVSEYYNGVSKNSYGDLWISFILLIVVCIIGLGALLCFKDYSQYFASNIGTGLITSTILSYSDGGNQLFYYAGLVVFFGCLLITAILFIYSRNASPPILRQKDKD